LVGGRSLDDSRVAQIQPIACIQVLSVIDDDRQPFDVFHVKLDLMRLLVAGDLRL
jgi:hypothetical protein